MTGGELGSLAMGLALLGALAFMLRLRRAPRAPGPPRTLWRHAPEGPGLTREVVLGDALEVRGQPALVIPANRQLTLGWGSHLAELVAARAGPEVEAEALAAYPEGVALGEAVRTGAGELEGYRHVIHAAVLDRHDLDPRFLLKLRPRTAPETLRAAARASLERAAEADLAGVVWTPMGAGIGGLGEETCARVLAEVLDAWERERPGGPLRTVVLACAAPAAAAAFQRVWSAREAPVSGAGGPGSEAAPAPTGPPPTR